MRSKSGRHACREHKAFATPWCTAIHTHTPFFSTCMSRAQTQAPWNCFMHFCLNMHFQENLYMSTCEKNKTILEKSVVTRNTRKLVIRSPKVLIGKRWPRFKSSFLKTFVKPCSEKWSVQGTLYRPINKVCLVLFGDFIDFGKSGVEWIAHFSFSPITLQKIRNQKKLRALSSFIFDIKHFTWEMYFQGGNKSTPHPSVV